MDENLKFSPFKTQYLNVCKIDEKIYAFKTIKTFSAIDTVTDRWFIWPEKSFSISEWMRTVQLINIKPDLSPKAITKTTFFEPFADAASNKSIDV